MTTPLTKPLKRELLIQGRPFIVTLSPAGIKLTLKGKRKGQELLWADLVSGEAALAVALNASLKGIPERDNISSGAPSQATASAAPREDAARPSDSPHSTPPKKRTASRSSNARNKRSR
jgi:hypothetical protein